MFARAVARNPWPTKWRLPGHRIDTGRPIEGTARRCIVHALTFHEIPRHIDTLICTLPSEKVLQRKNPIQRDYLSFTVYSLKQMVAAGTISADTAWSLFYGEWGKINNVIKINFKNQRKALIRQVRKLIGEDNLPKGLSLQEFEFYARAGRAGLAQYERYGKWAKNIIFDRSTCKDMQKAVKSEYRKALWLEMRIIEGQVGMRGLNDDIGKFILSNTEGTYESIDNRSIKCSIDIYRKEISEQAGSPIDTTIKAEIGHWMFDLLMFMSGWVAELMDRMNIAGYTEAINTAFSNLAGERDLSPEASAFKQGGFYLTSRDRVYGRASGIQKSEDLSESYPTYPEEFPEGGKCFEEPHMVAEYIERLIRKRIVRGVENGQIRSEDAYKVYRKIGVYVALLGLEGKTKEKILEQIESFNLLEMNEYYNFFRKKTISALRESKNYDFSMMTKNARALKNFKKLEKDSVEYWQLMAYELIVKGEWKRVVKLGKAALPALKAALSNGLSSEIMGAAEALGKIGHKEAIPALQEAFAIGIFSEKTKIAQALIRLKAAVKNSDIYKQWCAYYLIGEKKWRKVLKLGKSAIPILEEALGEDMRIRYGVIEVLENIEGKEAISALETALKHLDPFTRWKAVGAFEKKGKAAISILKKAIKEEKDPDVKEAIESALKRIRD